MSILPPNTKWDDLIDRPISNANTTATSVMQRNRIGILSQPASSWTNNSVTASPYDFDKAVTYAATEAYDNVIQSLIQGKMFLVSEYVPYSYAQEFPSKETDDEMKARLTGKLVDAMMRDNCVEFTKSYDSFSGQHIYRARCYATPDSQVQILRTQGIK
jgi:hypothetical protein